MKKEGNRKRHPDRVSKDFSLNNLTLEDPPPEAFRRRKSTKWEPITRTLRMRPDRWYRLQAYENPKSASSAVTTLKKLYRGQGFEFVHYEGKLWGRYVGTTGEKSASSASSTTTTATTTTFPEESRDDRRPDGQKPFAARDAG